jgi:lactoylglutathione lyase
MAMAGIPSQPIPRGSLVVTTSGHPGDVDGASPVSLPPGPAAGEDDPERAQTVGGNPMRTLHFGLRVADLERSLAFYTAVGYEVIGTVPETSFGSLTMLQLPDDDFVTIELVHDPAKSIDAETRLNHFVIKVASMDAAITELTAKGIDVEEPESPNDSDDFLTTWITDPDGNRIELVQWPPGHADGITAADWAQE